MKFKMSLLVAVGGIALIAACSPLPPLGQAYWQRVDDASALAMTGPKAQQRLEENIATCVREVDELVELDALRETMPPDTHSEYHHALDASGDLKFYDTPTRYGQAKVSHTDYHDFESCMRTKGWERVRYVRYQTALKAKTTNRDLQLYRKTGKAGDAGQAIIDAQNQPVKDSYTGLNR